VQAHQNTKALSWLKVTNYQVACLGLPEEVPAPTGGDETEDCGEGLPGLPK